MCHTINHQRYFRVQPWAIIKHKQLWAVRVSVKFCFKDLFY